MQAVGTTAAFLKDKLHAVRYVKDTVIAQCGTHSETSGIYYVPGWAFDGRATFGNAEVCLKCSGVLCAPSEGP